MRITLQQHWFGSAPVGLELSRGLQTIAKTRGISDLAPLKPHCGYKRPPDATGPTYPINWGWFWLDEERACLHRIGYAGTDEIGRPGNFLAHNLIISRADLEAIDFDVPCLLRWVRSYAEPRFTSASGADGFARNYQQLYTAFTKDKTRLATLEPLSVPCEQIQQMRQAIDARWNEEYLDPLGSLLSGQALERLLAVVWRPQAMSLPLLVILPTDGTRESADELRLAELLFAILPPAYRKKLSFATYEHEPQLLLGGSSAPGTPPPGPHRQRRLVFTTQKNEFKPALGWEKKLWLLDLVRGKAEIPPGINLARVIAQEIMQTSARVRTWRDLAATFEPENEQEGLRDAWRVQACRVERAESAEIEALIRISASQRKPWPPLLDLARQLLRIAGPASSFSVALRVGLGKAYLSLLAFHYPGLPPPEQSSCRAQAGIDLRQVLEWSALPEHDGLFQHFLQVFTSSGHLESLQAVALEALAAVLPCEVRCTEQNSAQRVAAKGAAQRFVKGWHTVQQALKKDDLLHQQFLDLAAQELVRALRHMDAKGHGLDEAEFIDEVILPMLQRSPAAQVEDVAWRLRFLEDVQPTLGDWRGGKLLTRMIGAGSLSAKLLTGLLRQPEEVLLRHYTAWHNARKRLRDLGQDESANILDAVLGNPALAALYWQGPADPRQSTHQQVRQLLANLAGLPAAQAKLQELYASEGQQRLLEQLAEPGSLNGAVLRELILTHLDLSELAKASAEPTFIVPLLALVLAQPAPADEEQGAWAEVLQRLAQAMQQRLSTWPNRRWAFEQAIPLLRKYRARSGNPTPALAMLHPLIQVLSKHFSVQAEGQWYWYLLHYSLSPTTSPDEVFRRTIARVLESAPELVAEAETGGDFAVDVLAWAAPHWSAVAERLLDRARDNIETLPDWLLREGKCYPLLLQLEAHGCLAAVAGELRQLWIEAGPDVIDLLGDVLRDDPPQAIAEAARQAIPHLLPSRLQEIARGYREEAIAILDTNEAGKALRLARLLAEVGPRGLSVADLVLYWKQLAQHLSAFKDAGEVIEQSPAVADFGASFLCILEQEPRLVWARLLKPIVEQAGRDAFVSAFKAIGERLCLRGATLALEGLLGVRQWKGWRECFVGPPRASKKGGRLLAWGRGPEEPTDRLLELLKQPPRALQGGKLNASALGQLKARALFAAAVYEKESWGTLLEIVHQVGYIGAPVPVWEVNVSALGLYHLLTGGVAPGALRQRTAALPPEFADALVDRFDPGEREAIRASLGAWGRMFQLAGADLEALAMCVPA